MGLPSKGGNRRTIHSHLFLVSSISLFPGFSIAQTQPEAKGQGRLFFKGQSPRADCIWKVSRVSKWLTGFVLPSLPPVCKDNLILEAEQPSYNLETANMRTEAQPKDGLVEGKRVCTTVDITWSLYQPGQPTPNLLLFKKNKTLN